MYSCRKFLGFFLTGLFLTGMFASSDFSMNNPKELKQNDKIKSIAPAVNLKADLDSKIAAAAKSLPYDSKSNDNRDCTDCLNDYTNYGSECCDSAYEETGITCAELETNYYWDCSGCLCPGDITCEDQSLVTCWDGSCAATLDDCPLTCEEQGLVTCDSGGCATSAEECAACPAGQIEDCDGSGECWAETWVGDGFCDGTAQQYGADLCCFNLDGGDCTEAECAAPSCGDGACNGDEDYYTCPQDCLAPGECGAGEVADCDGSGECWPESWIGDGFGDCEDQAYGADLTCYDNDGGDCDPNTTTGTTTTGGGSADCEDCVEDYTNYGSECCDTAWLDFGVDCATLEANYYWDCSGCECPGDNQGPSCEDQGLVTCWDGSCAASAGDCPDEPVIEAPTGVCASGSLFTDPTTNTDVPAITVTWDIPPSVCGNGVCEADEDYYTCPADCNASSADCADCEFDWTAYGSECCDTAWAEFSIDCATLETTYGWDCSGCNCPGDIACEEQGLITCEFGAIDGGNCAVDESGCLAAGECATGQVADCDGSGECWPESWIGDGFGDCEDQQYGADLTCYDNDGGDCDPGTTTGTTTTGGGSADCEDCVEDYTNYGTECCDTAWTEYGIDCATLESTYYWDCSGCNCPGDTTVVDCDANWDACLASLLAIESEYYDACSAEDCQGGVGGACDGSVVPGLTAECGFAASNIANGSCPDPCGSGRSEEARKLPVKTKDVSDYSTTSAAFIGDANSGGTRNDVYVVGLSCDACSYGGPFSGTFDGTPSLGEFTVYGFDLNSAVSVTLQSCTTAGACSDVVEVGTVLAGDTTSQECVDGGGGNGCDQAAGDSNNDGTINVLDVVGIVNHILAGGSGLEGCDLEVADYNGDELVNVLDVVAIVNLILAGGGRTADATDAVINATSNSVSISANGYIGGVQMTLSHGEDFSINLTDNAYVAEYITNGNSTTLIVINPEDEVIFTSNGNFDVEEVLVTNSEEFINVVNASLEFSLSNAYPNPFNPTTTIELNIAEASYASVKVFNLKGEVVGVLMDGMVDANAYTMTWDASNFASGVYMIRAEASGQIATQKVMLIK